MTPLQTPPAVSAPLEAAPPALKQQNNWIMDEAEDGIDSSPSVSFPLLMPQRNVPPRVAAAPSCAQALPAPSLQPQSFQFLKFPALKRENSRDSAAAASSIPQPIPIRPSEECFRGRSPSLQLIIDNELNGPPEPSSRAHRPQIRIQPSNSGAETPSHLARRGAEERTYLESQWRAEESLRRRHEVHNQERKARELIIDDDEDAHNDEISALMEKFTDFELNNEHSSYVDCMKRWVPVNNNRKLPSSNRENVAPSPPIILQKTFRRSVSAVIADSRGREDSDACVLYFPDGLPLVDECNEKNLSRNTSLASLENCNSFDMDSRCALSPHTHDVTEGSTPFGTISCHSTPNSVECQPVLGGEGEGGAPHFLRNNKKMMLRPKMTVRPKTPAKLTQSKVEGVTVPDQIDCSQRLFDLDCPDIGVFSTIPDLEESMLSMEADEQESDFVQSGHTYRRPFQRFDSEATIVCKNGSSEDNDMSCTESFDCPKSATKAGRTECWSYSSPEPIIRSQVRTNGLVPPPPQAQHETTPIEPFHLELKEPLSESDYCTPIQSNCTMRKQLAVKPSGVLDTLPELFLPSLNKISQPPSSSEDLSGVAKKF